MREKYINFDPASLIEYVSDRKGHDFRYAISNKKINNKLNWYPQYKFKNSLIKTIDWYCKKFK